MTDLPTTHPLDDAGSFSWMVDPDEPLRRSSTALALDGGWILVDPLDHPGLDAALAARPVLGVTRILDRHERDTEDIAERLGVPVLAPAVLAGRGEPLRHPQIEERVVLSALGWNESALWLPDRRLLVCADALGTTGYFLAADDERIGVHPLLRLRPPVGALSGLDPQAVAVGHGEPLIERAAEAVEHALQTARSQLPRAWGRALSLGASAAARRLRDRMR
jgi:hypothetical protein